MLFAEVKNNSLAGVHEITMLIESLVWPNIARTFTFQLEVIVCSEVDYLVFDGEGWFQDEIRITQIPTYLEIDLPLYSPIPTCRGTNADLEYVLITRPPSFVEIDALKRKVIINA